MNLRSVFTGLILLMMCHQGVARSAVYRIAYSSNEQGQNDIYLTDSQARSTVRVTDFAGGNGYSAWSPDGQQLAFYAKYDDRKTWSIHTINTDGTNRRRLTHEKNTWDYGPAWSPDGSKIAFAREYRDADQVWQRELWLMNADGSEQTQIQALSGGAPDFTPDGRLVFNAEFADKNSEISIANADGSGLVHLTDNEAEEWHPEVSPDGKQIAFMSNRDGNHEIYVMNIDGTDQKRLTHNEVDDWYPSWSPDGSELIFGAKTNDTHDVYVMNSDGTGIRKLIENGSQAAWLQLKTPEPMATEAESKLSIWDLPPLEQAYISTAPAQKNDGIPVGVLGVDGGDKARILKLANQLAADANNKYDSLLIAHQGKLLFESYYAKGRINLPHPMASTTKAYTGLALGRAMQLGHLSMADLHQPLVNFLKDLNPDQFAAGVDKITLHHALSMRSGLRIDDALWEQWRAHPEQLKGQRQVQAYFEHTAPINAASQRFLYQFDPDLVMQALDAVVPGSAEDFIADELLAKLGISNYAWRTGTSGLPSAGSGSSMTSRDMIKWGTLVMNHGQWHGEQLIPEAFIRQSTVRLFLTGDDDIYGGGKDVSRQGYGYYWWSADLQTGDTSHFAVSAQGGGGQFIILISELDLLVVVTALDNDNTTLQMLAEEILPAFM